MSIPDWNLGLHAPGGDPTRAPARALYQTTSYVFKSPSMPPTSSPEGFGNIYTRLMNPHGRLREAIAPSRRHRRAGRASGQAAITYALLAITRLGDEIVAADTSTAAPTSCSTTRSPSSGAR